MTGGLAYGTEVFQTMPPEGTTFWWIGPYGDRGLLQVVSAKNNTVISKVFPAADGEHEKERVESRAGFLNSWANHRLAVLLFNGEWDRLVKLLAFLGWHQFFAAEVHEALEIWLQIGAAVMSQLEKAREELSPA